MVYEIKPCPFCGGEAHVVKFYDMWFVECFADPCFATTRNYRRKEDAIDSWNLRAREECHNISEDGNYFVCSRCGCEVELHNDDAGYDNISTGEPKFCPFCGDWVVRG